MKIKCWQILKFEYGDEVNFHISIYYIVLSNKMSIFPEKI